MKTLFVSAQIIDTYIFDLPSLKKLVIVVNTDEDISHFLNLSQRRGHWLLLPEGSKEVRVVMMESTRAIVKSVEKLEGVGKSWQAKHQDWKLQECEDPLADFLFYNVDNLFFNTVMLFQISWCQCGVEIHHRKTKGQVGILDQIHRKPQLVVDDNQRS